MKGSSKILKIIAVAIFFSLIFASASYADVTKKDNSGMLSRLIWEDNFNDASKIDPSPPGSGLSDNYIVEGGKVKMINTYPAWTDPSWTKLKVIDVTNTAGQTLVNYALKLTIAYDSDMQTDYDDLRFKYQSDYVNYLNYWIESYDSTQAFVWVKIPQLSTGTSKLYMFYGNPSATGVSDFGSVFSDWNAHWQDDERITYHLDNEGTWDPDVCYGNGEFLVAWEEGQAYYPPYTWGFKQEIRASIYSTSGTKLVDDKLIFNDGTFYFRNENPSIAYGGGKWFVAWERYDTVANPSASTMDIRARLVSRSGSNLVLGSVINVCSASNCQADPNVAFDSVNNRFCVVWEDARLGTSDYNIYGRLYDTNGNAVGGEKTISTAANSQCEPWVAFNPVLQQYMIVWEEGITANNGPFSIKACRFDKDLNQIGTVKNIITGSENIDYNFPCVYFNQDTQQYLITWNSGDISSGNWWGDVWGTILDSSANTVVSNFIITTGNYVRTDIVTYPIQNMNDPYFVTYDDNNRIYGKLVTAGGVPSSYHTQLTIGSGANVKADWANIDIGDGKVFVAWEDTRVTYPSQYDFFPDIFANLWQLSTQFGSSVTYVIGSEKERILLAHVTSIAISKGAGDMWGQFNAIHTGSTIQFSILDGVTGTILIPNIAPGASIASITASSVRLMATFTRANPSTTPELDYWSVSYFQNNPPNPPSNPNPANGATDVDVNADLSWTCTDPDGDPLTYDVYFGTTSPPPMFASGISGNTCDPGVMSYGTTYYWKIVAFDTHGASTSGPIWSFTTWVNTPPNPPSNPNPANGATDVDVNADLSWTCTDPDGDPLTYDVYFGTITPPPLVSTGQTPASYDPGQMNVNQIYYWKIVAWDDHDASTSGPIWHFTTVENDPPYEPSDPDPYDGETGVDINADLSWTGGDPNGDPVTYDIYFGTTTPPPLFVSNYPYTTYDPGTMLFDKKYYWRIEAKDIHGQATSGPLWQFTTGANDPPYTPSNPSPADGATNVNIDTILSWSGGDPNPGDIVKYDLYLGIYYPPTIFVRDIETTSYPVSGMSYNTKYYWKIVAKDNQGASTDGPVWSFTTVSGGTNPPPNTPSITGPMIVKINVEYEYTVWATDPHDEDIYYRIYWGDETTEWLGPYPSGQEVTFSHTWTKSWTPYIIKVSAKDIEDNRCLQDGWLPVLVPRTGPLSSILIRIFERLEQNHPLFALLLKTILENSRIIKLLNR